MSQHWAGVRPYTSFYNFAKSYVFDKQSPLPFLITFKNFLIFRKHFFSQSYEVILPSSFNIILLTVLVYSTSPPASVLVRFL